jgi:hypothetical protein
MTELKRVDRRPKDCCNEPKNLRREDVAEGRYIEHCVCGNKHYVMEVEPLKMGIVGIAADVARASD